MKQQYYIFSSGQLRRKDNSIQLLHRTNTGGAVPDSDESMEDELQSKEESLSPVESGAVVVADTQQRNGAGETKEVFIPIESVEAIFCFSEVQFSRAVLSHFGKSAIPVFIYDFYGNYSGTYYPRSEIVSGERLVQQVKHHLEPSLKLVIAKEIVTASIKNMDATLAYYDNRGITLVAERYQVQNMLDDAEKATGIKRLLGAEGYARKHYYEGWKKILSPRRFNGRSAHPPKDAINALVSFLYSLLYNVCTNECYRAGLHPFVSYLHEPGERRNSLALDIADIFKPIVSDRIIFALLNSDVFDETKHAAREGEGCYLNTDGRKLSVRKFDEKLRTTFQHRELQRSISYRQLIQLECYKLLAHLKGEKKLKCFRAWW